jgi:disulfide bond formation protein DsbB
MITVFKRIGAARLIPLAILSASVGALGFAYTAEMAFGYEPCKLCLYQRIPFAVTGILALVALSGPMEGVRGSRTQTIVIALCGLVYLVGGAIAIYHVGVDQHWWASAVCGGVSPSSLTFEKMQQSLMQGEPKACDTFDWQLFGNSMAGYNIVYSILLAIGCFASTKLLRKAP